MKKRYQNFKRFSVLLLVLAMLFSMISPAFAEQKLSLEGGSDQTAVQAEEKVGDQQEKQNGAAENDNGANSKGELASYLQTLATKEEKRNAIASNTGTVGKFDPTSITSKGGTYYLTTRTKKTQEENETTLNVLSTQRTGIYPGAIVYADRELADGFPTQIQTSELPRKSVNVGLDIGGAKKSRVVENPTQSNVTDSINSQVMEWLNTKDQHQGDAAQIQMKSVFVNNQSQLEAAFGINIAKKLNIDIKSVSEEKKQAMVVQIQQIYYSGYVDSGVLADDVYSDSVKKDTFAKYFNKTHPAAAMIDRVDYGRTVMVTLHSESKNSRIKVLWDAMIKGEKVKSQFGDEDLMASTTMGVQVYGGNPETMTKLTSTKWTNFQDILKVLNEDNKFNKNTPGVVIGYSTHYIDDGTIAQYHRIGEYIETKTEQRNEIQIDVINYGTYRHKTRKFYYRSITGLDNNGKYILGDWHCMDLGSLGDQHFKLPGNAAEFGFSFDVKWGTDWPFSQKIWGVEKGVPSELYIYTGGCCRHVNVKITANNGQEVLFDKTNLSAGKEWVPSPLAK